MALKNRITVLILACVASFPSLATADDLTGHATVLGQFREDENNNKEFPFNTYLGFEFARPKWWDLSAETDMRLFRDWQREWDDYDLYQAVIHVTPSKYFRFDMGRQFLAQGFTTDLADAVKVTWRPQWPMEFTAYSGVPRTVERGDFNQNDGLLTGLSVKIKDIPHTHIQFHAAWRKADILVTDIRENDSFRVGADASYLFGGSWKPLVYGLAEYNAPGKVLETGSLGFDLYPRQWVAFNTELNTWNSDHQYNRPSILGLFSEGRILSGRFSSTWTIISEYLDLEQSYSYQSIEVTDGNKRSGHLLEAAFPTMFDSIGLTLNPGYYFASSYGGNVHGVRLSVHEQFTKKWYAETAGEGTLYEKVTGDDDNAYSVGLWSGYEIAKNLVLSTGAEYNTNNLFERDFRGSFKLQYRYGFF